jgi:integrase/recombinase XerD
MQNAPSLFNEFIFHCQYEKNLSPKTLKAYKIDLYQFLQYSNIVDEKEIVTLQKETIKHYIQYLFDQTLKEKTIKRKLATLKAFFNYLEFDEKIATNPFSKMRLSIKEPKRVPKTIDIKEIKKILSYVYKVKKMSKNKLSYQYKSTVRDILVLELLFSTGMRVSEICNLELRSFDFKLNTLKIVGKGNKERTLHIVDVEVKSILQEYLTLFHDNKHTSSYLLLNRLGNKISEQSVRFMVKKYQKLVGITKHITPHMFRHSFATMLLEEGVDIRYIQHILGHASISTTQIYTQVNLKHQKKILTTKHPRRNLKFTSS